MIKGIGLEIVDVLGVWDVLGQERERFLQQFTEGERDYCLRRRISAQHLAARLAAKRAILKALGYVGETAITCVDIEIKATPSGSPYPVLQGSALHLANLLDVTRWHLSLSHTELSAVAFALAET